VLAAGQLPDLDHAHQLPGAGSGSGEILEGATGREDATGDTAAERLQPLQQRSVRIDRNGPQVLPQLGLHARLAGREPEQLSQAALLAHLDDDRAQAPLCGEQPDGGGHRGLAHAALAGDREELAFEW
jgi:hypothetical protein